MGSRRKSKPAQQDLQAKADAFDKQWNESHRAAQVKREAGLFPYDIDHVMKKAGKPGKPSRRKTD